MNISCGIVDLVEFSSYLADDKMYKPGKVILNM